MTQIKDFKTQKTKKKYFLSMINGAKINLNNILNINYVSQESE